MIIARALNPSRKWASPEAIIDTTSSAKLALVVEPLVPFADHSGAAAITPAARKPPCRDASSM